MSPIFENEYILDYGCGVGTTIRYIKKKTSARVHGYDINRFVDDDLIPFFQSEVNREYNKIIFQHSIAHIPNLNEVLTGLKKQLAARGEIYVITPNAEFDNFFKAKRDPNYKSDTTVHKHYTSQELIEIFEHCGFKIRISGTFGATVNNIHERCFLIAVNE